MKHKWYVTSVCYHEILRQHKNGRVYQRKEIMCQKVPGITFLISILNLWGPNMENKLTSVKCNKKISVSRGKNPKLETTRIGTYAIFMWKLSFMQSQRQTRMPVLCNVITQCEDKILSSVQGGVYKWFRRTNVLYSVVVLTTTLQGNANELSIYVFQYAIQLHHQKCRCKICCHENIRQ
jgi:hypothetical protein